MQMNAEEENVDFQVSRCYAKYFMTYLLLLHHIQ
jgi:hypothetical protein